MKKTETTAVKTENTAKTGTVVLLKTVLEPETKPEATKTEKSASKAEVKPEAAKAEKSDPKSEAKSEEAKTEKFAPKPETKPEAAKAEKSASLKPEAKSETAKVEKAAPEPEAKPEAAKVEKSVAPKPDAKSEAAKTEKSAIPKPETKTEAAKAEKSVAPKPKAKPKAIKVEKSASQLEVKAEPAKAGEDASKSEAPTVGKSASRSEAESKPAKAGNPSPVPEVKAEPPVQAAKPESNAGEQVIPPPASGEAPSVPNPPAVPEKPAVQVVDSPLKRMKQEFTERTNVIKQEMRNIQNSFLVIGFQLHWIKTNNMYKVLNYKNIMDYAEKEFGIKKSTCCNFINIIENYAERDENGEVIESIAECYRNFSSSQLIAMIGMPEEVQQQVTPDMSVRTIQNLKKGEPEKPPVDAPKAVISEAEAAAPAPVHEAPKPAATVPVHEVPKPTAPVHEVPKSAVSAPVREVPKSTVSVPVHEVSKPAGPASKPTVNNSGKPMDNHRDPVPRTLLEIESYSGYRSMVDKIDKLVKDAFSAGKQMRVKIVCEEE